LIRKGQVLIDTARAPVIKQMFEKVAYESWTGRKLYHWLRFEMNFKTKSNHPLSLGNIYLILDNHFFTDGSNIRRGAATGMMASISRSLRKNYL